jgi:hypothetical protein
VDADEHAKRKRSAAAHKAAETKGPEERSRTAKMANYTMKHGKNDAQNPHSKENHYPGGAKPESVALASSSVRRDQHRRELEAERNRKEAEKRERQRLRTTSQGGLPSLGKRH